MLTLIETFSCGLAILFLGCTNYNGKWNIDDTIVKDYLKEKILQPAGMNNTFTGVSKNPMLNINKTIGYQNGRKLEKDFYDDIMGDKGSKMRVKKCLFYRASKLSKMYLFLSVLVGFK